jgi:hypothetical protein
MDVWRDEDAGAKDTHQSESRKDRQILSKVSGQDEGTKDTDPTVSQYSQSGDCQQEARQTSAFFCIVLKTQITGYAKSQDSRNGKRYGEHSKNEEKLSAGGGTQTRRVPQYGRRNHHDD